MIKNCKEETHEMVIIGAGVSGCSTAIRLIQKGISPLIIDKDSFPRDTVGEGLSAAIGPYLKELGILDEVLACPHVVQKRSLQLVSPGGYKAYTEIDFNKPFYNERLHDFPFGFNVRRKYFDMIFFDKAIELGADIRTKMEVVKVLTNLKGDVTGLIVKNAEGERIQLNTSLVIDCSGRSSVLAKQLDIRGVLEDVFDGQWANFAIRLHFTNVNMEYLTKDIPNYDPATVNILPDKDCWYWFIPLDIEKGLISIGFVARYKLKQYIDDSSDKKQAYINLIAKHPVLKKVIEGAQVSDDIVATSRLGHMNSKMCGAGYICIGDAAFFADPAWGTGVTIALRSSKIAADCIEKAYQKSDYSETMTNAYESDFRKFIQSPFNSIRAYNYYYNDSEYVDFIVNRLNQHPTDMDMIGAVLFDYASHDEFQKWTFKEFKAFVKATGRLPVLTKVSQFNFDNGTLAGQTISNLMDQKV